MPISQITRLSMPKLDNFFIGGDGNKVDISPSVLIAAKTALENRK